MTAALSIHPTVARLLCLRGFGDPAVADRFLNPSLDHLHDPFLLDRHGAGRGAARTGADARRADRGARRLRRRRHHLDRHPPPRARDARRQGESTSSRSGCATATDCSLRRSIGCTPSKIDVIVSVDCGIRGTEAAQRARELGLDLIITDHHEPEGTLPGRARRSSIPSVTTAPIPTRTSPASAWR